MRTLHDLPGSCPDCGEVLSPVFVDWIDKDAHVGMSGGMMWSCAPCNAPQFLTWWSQLVRNRRVALRVTMNDLASIVGCTVPELSRIENGYDEPTMEQRASLDIWLDETGGCHP